MAAKSKTRDKKADRLRGKPFTKGDPRAGRPKGAPNKVTAEVRKAAQGLVEDPVYRASLKERLQSGKLAPAMEALLWHYAYGKPKEVHELVGQDGEPLTFTLNIDARDRD